MGGTRVDDPDAFIGNVLADAVELVSACEVTDEELKRHAWRRTTSKESRLRMCVNWAKQRKGCEYGDDCRYFHVEPAWS